MSSNHYSKFDDYFMINFHKDQRIKIKRPKSSMGPFFPVNNVSNTNSNANSNRKMVMPVSNSCSCSPASNSSNLFSKHKSSHFINNCEDQYDEFNKNKNSSNCYLSSVNKHPTQQLSSPVQAAFLYKNSLVNNHQHGLNNKNFTTKNFRVNNKGHLFNRYRY
jgi:hypothetical protein